MPNEMISKKALQEAISPIAEAGITADRKRLKEDMTLQFKDFHEWIREYVVNSYDAGASRVRIFGLETEEELTVIVEDNGNGMDGQRVTDFMTVFASKKDAGVKKPVGQHGIGKLSVAAIPGQCGFKMLTSTGKEVWRLETGRLLGDQKMTLERIDMTPCPPQGTRFEITFAKKQSIENELMTLRAILEKYVRYLPIDIIIGTSGQRGVRSLPINRDWRTDTGQLGRQYNVHTDGMDYEVTFGIDVAEHEVYQNRVLVSSDYNLFSRDFGTPVHIPHVRVRVDSPKFDLPFGRHGLRNEEVLSPLSRHLREVLLPKYIEDAYVEATADEMNANPLMLKRVEEAALALLRTTFKVKSYLTSMPLFEDVTHRWQSLDELKKAALKYKVIYLESKDAVGVDYSIFPAPVLSCNQSSAALETLRVVFKEQLLNLGLSDVVLEAMPGSGPPLGEKERRFEIQLQFHLSSMSSALVETKQKRDAAGRSMDTGNSRLHLEEILGVCEEARYAHESIENVTFRVNYLVGPDGKSPSPTRRYLVNNQEVVLNLYHPKVQAMLVLSEKAPALAGHFGLAMVLSESRDNLFKTLTAEAREDLILADAISKCGTAELREKHLKIENKMTEWDFMLRMVHGKEIN